MKASTGKGFSVRNFQRVLFAVSILILVLAILAFVLENLRSVSLQFLGWASPEIPLSLVALLALLVGMIIGPAVSWLLKRVSRSPRKRLT